MSSTETWSFFYNPLDRSRNEIRLVHIHAALDYEAKISCSLSHVSLDDQPIYYALSYSWGSTQKTRSILLDEQEFAVTENLYEALREVRSWSRSIGVWIDQISLNQEDVVERNQEVLRMLEIYRGAMHVIVWIGTASDRTADAIDCLRKLSFFQKVEDAKESADIVLRWLIWASYYAGLLLTPIGTVTSFIQGRDITCIWIAVRIGLIGKLFRFVSGGRSLRMPLWGLVARPINLFMYLVFLVRWWRIYKTYRGNFERNLRPTDAAVDALKDVFTRDWFRRIWIVQEISVAREATVLCGSYALEWKVVVQAVTRMENEVWRSRTRHPYLDTDYEFASMVTTTYTRIRSDKDYERVGLLYLLSRFCYYKATIAHDKAYGLLGLCAEVQNQTGKDIALEPRYDKPVEYAFADVVRYSIENSQRLDILRACTGHRRTPQMPSWVPDWTIVERKDNGGGIQWEERYTLPEPKDPLLPIAEFSADLKSLRVHGVIIGQVTNVGEESVMRNVKTGVLKNLPNEALPIGFNVAYLVPLITLFARIGVIHWFCKLAARRFAARHPGTVLEDCEEVVDILATEVKHMSNLTGSSVWETMYEFWKTDIPLTHDVPRSAASMSEKESWNRSCTWEAVPELGLLPLLPMISTIETSADMPQPGDAICMMLGSSIPYILRDKGDFYELIGSGKLFLINRFLWKAVVKGYRAGNVELQEFVIR
jgi:hypothetical protein